MKAVYINGYGGAEALVVGEMPVPKPGPGEILVRVCAAGVNPIDWKIREGHFQQFLPHTFPLVLGWDVSGEVEALGDGVTGWRPGDAVFAYTDVSRSGVYAERAVVPASFLVPKPSRLTHTEAASLPIVTLTAHQALFGAAGLRKGHTVLIHGAAGGVGSVAVQMARYMGARVLAMGARDNAERLHDLGADEVGAYPDALSEFAGRADIVLDTIGGEIQEQTLAAMRRGAYLASVVSAPDPERMAARGVRGRFVATEVHTEMLQRIGSLVQSRRIKPLVHAVLPLADAARAHQWGETGLPWGKLVLTPPGV